MLKNQLLTMISAWKVNPYTRWQAADHRSLAYDRIAPQIGDAAKHIVLSGPYQGMKYFGPQGVPIIDRHPTTKFLGSFEADLHPWIETLIKDSSTSTSRDHSCSATAGALSSPFSTRCSIRDSGSLRFSWSCTMHSTHA